MRFIYSALAFGVYLHLAIGAFKFEVGFCSFLIESPSAFKVNLHLNFIIIFCLIEFLFVYFVFAMYQLLL